ncbi:MAG: hypothetical protein IPP10_16340 [Candidatus Competibacteraceae bacterium]|nr:hypothetical protein [Candidatus Competibacteraceae bacterium]
MPRDRPSLTGAPAVDSSRPVNRPRHRHARRGSTHPTPWSRHEVTPSRLHLASRFTPKPEVPYPELIRQAAARKQSQDTAPASDDPPGSSDPPTPSA